MHGIVRVLDKRMRVPQQARPARQVRQGAPVDTHAACPPPRGGSALGDPPIGSKPLTESRLGTLPPGGLRFSPSWFSHSAFHSPTEGPLRCLAGQLKDMAKARFPGVGPLRRGWRHLRDLHAEVSGQSLPG